MAEPVAPPHDLDAEMSVLGSILLDPDAIFRIADQLDPTDFYRASHGFVYKAALRLSAKSVPVDQVTIAAELGTQLDLVGGRAQLAVWQSSTPTARNVEHYAGIVREKANLWRLRRAGEAMVAEVDKNESDFDAVLARAQESVFAISQDRVRTSAVSVGELLNAEWERLLKLSEHGSAIVGVPTGYTELDRMIGGLEKDDLIIVAGRPSMGKTAWAMNIAVNFALAGRGVLFFSLEMSEGQLMERLLALVAGVDAQRLHRGMLNEADIERVSQAMGPISTAPFYIDDQPGLDELKLLTKARKEAAMHPIDLIVIDYLQLMDGVRAKEGRVQEVSAISRALKRLARQIGVPVIAISQLSRKTEEHPDKKPWLSDLRESGQIEADADIVLLLWREDYYNKDVAAKKANICEIHVAKQRRGPTGTVSLHFNRSLTKFADLDLRRGENE